MPAVTIDLDLETLQALERIAKENGYDAPAHLLSQQAQRLVKSYRERGLTPGLKEHLETILIDHRVLLERLAK